MSAELPALALLAGGMATRLYPISERIAKSMVEVAGEPFIAHQLSLLAREGVHRVVICCGHFHEQIEQFVGTGRRFGLEVLYSYDGASPLGTGGALLRALPLLGSEFMVMYGDSYLDVRLVPIVKAFRNSCASGLMTVLRNENLWDSSNILLEAGRIVVYDKIHRTPAMRHIDFGLGCLRPEAFDGQRPDKAFDLVEIYRRLIDRSRLAAYEVSTRFFEIGTPAGLAETDSHIRARLNFSAGNG